MPTRLISFALIKYPDPASNYTHRKRCYRVTASGTFVFSRKADAVSFCDRLSDAVTMRVRDLNRVTADVYTEYRRRCLGMEEMEREDCARAFAAIDKQIGILLRRAHHGPSGYILAQQHINVWAGCLREVLDQLRSVSAIGADTEARAALRICRDRVDAAVNDMETRPAKIYREMECPSPTPALRQRSAP